MKKYSAAKFLILAAAMALLALTRAGKARAITVDIDTFGLSVKYEAIVDSSTVMYMDQCMRKKFKPYEWKAWQGYYSVKAYIQPIATIRVRREDNDPIMDDMTPFIERAIKESIALGGNMVCRIKLIRSKKELGVDTMIFRSYRQFFSGSYKELEVYYEKLGGGKPVSVEDTYKVADSTENASTLVTPPPPQNP